MITYVYAFILTAVVAVTVEMLTPAGEGGRLGSHVRFIAGLCLLIALIQPLREGISILRSVADGRVSWPWEEMIPEAETDYEAILRDELTSLGKMEAEAWVSAVLMERFGIPKENHTCTVTVSLGDDGMTPVIDGVTILLTGASIFQNPHAIEAYITDRLRCSCTVAIG